MQKTVSVVPPDCLSMPDPVTLVAEFFSDRCLLPSAGVRHGRNYSWAELLRRVWELDILECPRCLGRMRIVAAIHTPDAITKILDSLGLPASSPRLWQKPPLIFLTIASVCGLTDDLDIIEFAENRSEKGASRTFIIGNDDAQLFDRPRHEDFADVAYAAESLR